MKSISFLIAWNYSILVNIIMNREKIILLIIFTLLTNSIRAQICTNAYYDGYWGGWKEQWIPAVFSWETRKDLYELYGNPSGFIVYNKGDHPSNYVFKFQINNYIPPTKQQIKEHYKRQEWYEYTGIVEYFVIESAPTIKEILKKWGFPLYHQNVTGEPCAKRVANARIIIAPYKKQPEVYNYFFDDVGVGIHLVYVHFNN